MRLIRPPLVGKVLYGIAAIVRRLWIADTPPEHYNWEELDWVGLSCESCGTYRTAVALAIVRQVRADLANGDRRTLPVLEHYVLSGARSTQRLAAE